MSDPLFKVEVLQRTENPQQLVWAAMHQDYSEHYVYDEVGWDGGNPALTEDSAGKSIITHLLASDRGHYGPLEHPHITLNCGYFPHSVMQQIRTHRVGISFDVQSGRYTGQRILDLVQGERTVEEVFYIRPPGTYTDRSGKSYEVTPGHRISMLQNCVTTAHWYANDIRRGLSEEHARSTIAFDIRQHWVMTVNARSLMHLLDLRWKADAQLECQWMCDLIAPHFQAWMPDIHDWYMTKRAHKARLSP
jgi:thymidylate synthase (FAD)